METPEGSLDRRLTDGLSNHQAGRTRPARGPRVLGSISNSTCEPRVNCSKAPPSTLERWKKYSTPSSAARKPNPRSFTDLIVPIAICNLPYRKAAFLASLGDRPAREGSYGERSHTNAWNSPTLPQSTRICPVQLAPDERPSHPWAERLDPVTGVDRWWAEPPGQRSPRPERPRPWPPLEATGGFPLHPTRSREPIGRAPPTEVPGKFDGHG